ncbi:MAG: hypothetical protein HQK49_21445 [Oligoflexia bacterium]|nr:hypothetical protein [Oligoflexia bacterium]
MGAVYDVFQRLGIDGSFFYQLGIIIFTILASRFIFFERLRAVFEEREKKTLKLDQKSQKMLKEAEEIAREYAAIIEDANKKAKKFFEEEKKTIVLEQKKVFKSAEEEFSKELMVHKNSFYGKASEYKGKVLSEVDMLAGVLRDRVVK